MFSKKAKTVSKYIYHAFGNGEILLNKLFKVLLVHRIYNTWNENLGIGHTLVTTKNFCKTKHFSCTTQKKYRFFPTFCHIIDLNQTLFKVITVGDLLVSGEE